MEFIAVAYMIDRYGDKTNDQLAQAIRDMRLRVRELHNHRIMRNKKVWTTLVESMPESLEHDARGVKRRFEDDVSQTSRKLRCVDTA